MLEGHIQGITSSTICAYGALEIPGTFTSPCFGKSGFEAFACHVKLCIENSHLTGSVNGSFSGNNDGGMNISLSFFNRVPFEELKWMACWFGHNLSKGKPNGQIVSFHHI